MKSHFNFMKPQTLEKNISQGEDSIRVTINVQEKGLMDITLMDLQGNLIHNESDFVSTGDIDYQLPIKRPLDKKCLLRVAINGKSEIKKIIA